MPSTNSAKALRAIAAGLLALSLPLGLARAQNENEEIGFSSKHIFEGDYFGENVDVLNGNLVLTIPIGQKFRASAGLEYGLLLTYNSKVWLEKDAVGYDFGLMASTYELDWDPQSQKQIHNAGLGFRLLLGRIFYVRKDTHNINPESGLGEGALDIGWYYQDQNGTSHPLMYCPDTEMLSEFDPNRSDPPDPKEVCPFDGSTNHYGTTDATYMRAVKIFNASSEHIGWYLWPGDGTRHTFLHHPDPGRNSSTGKLDPKLDPDTPDVRGFYVTRIEGIEKYVTTDTAGNTVVVSHNFIDITYDEPPRHHSMLRIDEYRVNPLAGPTPSTPSRTILFTNVSALTAPSCNPAGGTRSVSVHGGLVASISLPSFGGNRSVYDFEHCIDDVSAPSQMSTCSALDGCEPGRDHVFSSVPLLRKLHFPAISTTGAREVMEFSYTEIAAQTGTHGELTERQLPTGARIRYEYGYYDYGMQYLSVASGYRKGVSSAFTGCKCTDTRQIAKKQVFDSAGDGQPDTWTYVRKGDLPRVGDSASVSRNPTRVHVTDPEGNETVYHYWSSDDEYVLYLNGLNYRTETYLGRWGTGKLIRTERSGYGRRGTGVPSERANIQRVERAIEFSDDGQIAGQHGRRSESWAYDTLGNELIHAEREVVPAGRTGFSRTTQRTWKTIAQLTPFEKANWLIHLQQEVNRFDGQGKLQGRTIYTLTEEGRVRADLRLARPDAGPTTGEDLQAVYCFDGDDMVSTPPENDEVFPFYDPTAATYGCTSEPNLDQIRSGNIILKKLSGGATAAEPNPPPREIEYTYQAGAYLAGKRFRLNGAPLGWWAFERDRDLSTGLIATVRDTAGVNTGYRYDALGRLTHIEPDAQFGIEHVTEVRYPSLTRTVVLQGPSATLGGILYDSASPCSTSGDYTCTEYLYDGLARLTQTRKRRYDGSLATEHRCYTPGGKPTEQSEWISSATAFTCGESAGAPRTRTYYTATSDTRSDPLGRPRRVVTADNFLTEYEYSGQMTTIKVHGLNRATDSTGIATTVQVRDAFDRLVRVDSEGAADATYTYDTDDRLVEVALGVLNGSGKFAATPPVQRRQFVYDRLGRMTEEAHPENSRTRYLAFDPLGSVRQRQDARGLKFRSTYDAAGRLEDEELETAQGWRLLAHNVYDTGVLGAGTDRALGKLTRVDSYDDAGALVSRRDVRYAGLNGRLDREETLLQGWTSPLRTTYRYNSFGLLEQLDYPGDPLWTVPLLASYQYTNGYLARAETQNAPRPLIAKAITYSMAGALQSWEGGNTTRTTIDPDTRNRPARIYVDRLSVDQVSARALDPESVIDREKLPFVISKIPPLPHH